MSLISSFLRSKKFPISSRFIQFQSLCTHPDQKLSKKQFRSKSQKTVDYVQVQGEILYGINPVLMALEAEKRKFHCVTSFCGGCTKRLERFKLLFILNSLAFRYCCPKTWKLWQIYYNAASKRTKEIIEAATFRGIPCEKSERGVLGQLAKHSSKEVGVHQGICAGW